MLIRPTPKVLQPRVLVRQRYDVERRCAGRREVDAPTDDLSGRLDEPHDAVRGHGLAGTGFADDGSDLASRHVEADVPERLGRADVCLEIDCQVADFEYVVGHRQVVDALLPRRRDFDVTRSSWRHRTARQEASRRSGLDGSVEVIQRQLERGRAELESYQAAGNVVGRRNGCRPRCATGWSGPRRPRYVAHCRTMSTLGPSSNTRNSLATISNPLIPPGK